MAESIVRQPSTSNTQHNFSDLPAAEVQRSTFDRSHGWKSTIPEAGKLIPMCVDEIVPGDSVNMHCKAFVRMSTPIHPIMDQLYIRQHWFSVANRLVYPEFVNMMGEQKNPSDDITLYTVPQTTVDNVSVASEHTLADFFGLPIGQPGTSEVSAMPFWAYKKVWNDWFRDQNIMNPADETSTDFNLIKGTNSLSKTKDYFTSCLPWPQKGDQVVVPLGDNAEVFLAKKADPTVAPSTGAGQLYRMEGPPNLTDSGYRWNANSTDGKQDTFEDTLDLATNQLYTDLTSATATSINDLRTAFQIQRLLERDARSGTRYIETVLAHFGVESDDRRQFRPEYLGGSMSPMQITPVANTSATATEPQGSLSAVGTGVNECRWNHAWTEHSILLGCISIKSSLTYQQGIEKQWLRKTRYDFYYPVFQHLGEQAVLNKELFTQGDANTFDEQVFGYQERWAEMRYKPGRICGFFRSNSSAPLDAWHLAQDFAALPTLNNTFLYDTPPVDRVVAVPSEPHFIADVWFDMKHTRPLPVYSVPGLVDHF